MVGIAIVNTCNKGWRILEHDVVNKCDEMPELCSALDSAIANLAADLVAQTSDLVASELESTIRSWDMNTMVAKIESQVGNDLQYIRLNGTFVGGLIGIGIFLITTMASAI